MSLESDQRLVEFGEVVLDRVKVTNVMFISPELIDGVDWSMHAAFIADELAMRLNAHIYCEDVETRPEVARVAYPATWWQHFKQACFPRWLLRWSPVRHTEVVRRADVTKFAAYPMLPRLKPECGVAVTHYRVDSEDDEGERR